MEAQSKVNTIFQHVKEYVETRAKLMVVDTADKASSAVSSIAFWLLLTLSVTFVLLFLSIGAAIWIGHAYGETSMGFLIIGLFYLVVTLLVYAGRDKLIKTPVANSIISTIYSDEKD
jgi:hypothetical protein